MMHGYGYGWMPGYGMGIVMMIFWAALIIVVVASVVWLLRATLASRNSTPPPRTAVQLLEERYARGEIGREEFMEKKRDLES